MKEDKFRFRKADRIGAASAEEDAEFLRTCFINTGDWDILKNIDDHRVIVLGRTGTGKSALLKRLGESNQRHAIVISPDDLALTYVSNSTILNFFAQLGVNLDPFFKLLWRHVIIVEILSHCLQDEDSAKSQNIIDKLINMFTSDDRKDKGKRQAIDYLQKWGKSFWLETEYRVKEITETLESKLDAEVKSAIGVPGNTLASSLNAAQSLSTEQISEIQSRAQRVVSETQVQDLNRVVELLAKVLEDKDKYYYVIVDRLDENWVEERLRYKLIMALVATAREFIQVRHAKVVLAMRRDLMDRVFRMTRDSGFQEEKYNSLYLPLTWAPSSLINLLAKRVSALVAFRAKNQRPTYRDLLPKEFDRKQIDDFITGICSTPRDIIALFNECIIAAVDQPRLTSGILSKAVGRYSSSRLRALADEWNADFPGLIDFTKILERQPKSFKLQLLSISNVEELCLSICSADPAASGILHLQAMKVLDRVIAPSDFKIFLIQVFYKIGLVGLKLSPHEEASWVEDAGRSISTAEVTDDTSICIHPKFMRALGIRPN